MGFYGGKGNGMFCGGVFVFVDCFMGCSGV